MELNDYQKKAMETKMDSCDNFSYMMLNLVGEVGEFASKVAKSIRRKEAMIGTYNPMGEGLQKSKHNYLLFLGETEEEASESMQRITMDMAKEAGDILWQLAGLCDVMGWSLEDVAQMNLDKLASRKQRGVIDGNGDNR